MSKTLLVIAPGRDVTRDCVFNLLVAETGEHLHSHFCSHSFYAESDLYSGRPERIEKIKERFGEVEIKFIDETDITSAELHRRNKEWWEANHKEENNDK